MKSSRLPPYQPITRLQHSLQSRLAKAFQTNCPCRLNDPEICIKSVLTATRENTTASITTTLLTVGRVGLSGGPGLIIGPRLGRSCIRFNAGTHTSFFVEILLQANP